MHESLVKYLAGLLDADGSLAFQFKRDYRYPDKLYVSPALVLHSSDAIDKLGFVSGLPELTGMGGVYRHGDKQQFIMWVVKRRSDLEMLLPRLIKHMVIKARHWQWMLDAWRAHRGRVITDDEMASLKEVSKESRRTRVGPIHPKNRPTWAWLAGYLDGDGYYSCNFKKNHNSWAMRIGSVAHKNDIHVLEFIQKSFGGRIVPHGQTADCFNWYRQMGVEHRAFALRFLPNVTKHSRLKKHKIDQMIHIHQQRLSAPAPTGEAIV